MTTRTYSPKEACARGEAIYREKIRRLVEPQEHGKFVVIDIETGDYEIDTEDITATLRLLEIHPDAVTYAVRVGFRAAYSTGGGSMTFKP